MALYNDRYTGISNYLPPLYPTFFPSTNFTPSVLPGGTSLSNAVASSQTPATGFTESPITNTTPTPIPPTPNWSTNITPATGTSPQLFGQPVPTAPTAPTQGGTAPQATPTPMPPPQPQTRVARNFNPRYMNPRMKRLIQGLYGHNMRYGYS